MSNSSSFLSSLRKSISNNQGFIALFVSLGTLVYFLVVTYYQEDNPQRTRPSLTRITQRTKDLSHQRTVSFLMPSNMNFAGEKVPISDVEVYRRIDKELHQVVFYQSRSILVLKRANEWFPQFEDILDEYGVPEDIKFLVAVESQFENVVSYRGAAGFWQFMPATAREWGLRVDDEVDERYHPIKSAHAAAQYLKHMQERLGSWTLAAAAYNMGYGALKRHIRQQEYTNYYDLLLYDETSRYIPRILAYKLLLRNPDRFGYKVEKDQLYIQEKTHEIVINEDLPNLSAFAKSLNITLKTLRFFNPWLRSNSLTIKKEGEEYTMLIPKRTVIDGEEIMVRIPPALRRKPSL